MVCQRLRAQGRIERDGQARERRRGGSGRFQARDRIKAGSRIEACFNRVGAEARAECFFDSGELVDGVRAAGRRLWSPTLELVA